MEDSGHGVADEIPPGSYACYLVLANGQELLLGDGVELIPGVNVSLGDVDVSDQIFLHVIDVKGSDGSNPEFAGVVDARDNRRLGGSFGGSRITFACLDAHPLVRVGASRYELSEPLMMAPGMTVILSPE